MNFKEHARVRLHAVPAAALTMMLTALCTHIAFISGTSTGASAKTPGSTYCFYGKCHRVKTIAETHAVVGKAISLYSSHYDACHKDPYNPCGLTSSGEKFYPHKADNAASPIYPDGTKLLVWSQDSKEAAVIRINNAGPYWGNRKLDVSRALARKLGFERRGVAKLQVRVLQAPTRAEARYKRNRRYDKVHGPIGKFDSLDDAEKGLAVLLAFEAMTTSMWAPGGGSAVSQVERPFEVAAVATAGRAFASVEPEMKQWPVVARQFASVDWPVVTTGGPATASRYVRLAGIDNADDTQKDLQQVAAAELTSWPVVTDRMPRSAGRATLVADAGSAATPRQTGTSVRVASLGTWPVVTTRLTRTATSYRQWTDAGRRTWPVVTARLAPKVGEDKSAQPLRVAALTSSNEVKATQKRADSTPKEAQQVRQRSLAASARKAQTRRGNTARGKSKKRAWRSAKAPGHYKAAAKPKRKAGPLMRRAQRKPEPHVVTRDILHRALGRGA